VNWLTRQEQFVLATVLTLLLVGLAVKTYRTAHPAAPPTAAAGGGQPGTAAPTE